MILESKGIRTDKFYVPPFDLNEGEIIVLYLYNGEHYYETEMFLKDIFTGKTKNENVKVHQPMKFAEHFIEPTIRRVLYPVTVGEYLRKNANPASSYSTKIYDIEWMTEKIKINTLAGNPRKLLSIYSTLSNNENIVFDVIGQDPHGAEKTYEIVKENVKNGGSAILLDCFNDMKDDCTKYIELEWTKQ